MHLGFALRRHSRRRGCDPTCTEEPAGGAKWSFSSCPSALSLCLVPGWSTSSHLEQGWEALLQWEPFPWIFPFRALTHQPGGAVSLSGGYSARLRVIQHQTWCHPPCCQEEPRQPSASDHKKSPPRLDSVHQNIITDPWDGFGLRAGVLSSLLLLQVNTHPASCLQAPSSHRYSTWTKPLSSLRSGTRQARRSTRVSVTSITGMPTLPSSFMTLLTR